MVIFLQNNFFSYFFSCINWRINLLYNIKVKKMKLILLSIMLIINWAYARVTTTEGINCSSIIHATGQLSDNECTC